MLDVEDRAKRASGGKLRTGHTTGACAAAASKAAALALASGHAVASAEICLPRGGRVSFAVARCRLNSGSATCCVIKDAGDDPDVTHGAEICATVSWVPDQGVFIEGGDGVGRVTRPGLGLDVGGPAINPVPRRMITDSVLEAIGSESSVRGVRVVISVPRGREMSLRTLNPRLGIVDGISILGTTGIVTPYSTAAFRSCIVQAINVARANGAGHLVLSTGGRSEAFAQKYLSLPEIAFIQVGDWVGFALKASVRRGTAVVTLCGMLGKLSKLASGQFQTHVSRSSADMAFLASVALRSGVQPDVCERVRAANTARHIYEIVSALDAGRFFNEVCRLACSESWKSVQGKVAVECLMTDFNGDRLLGRAFLDAGK